MGLFGKLFEKKECAICGGEIGLFGNRKLEDGNMCKHCAAKLSPWFEDRRESTVAQIGQQLAYREENQQAVAAFQSTRILGEDAKLHIDETQGKFLVMQSNDEENPDVLDLSQVLGVDLDIEESHTEEKRTDDDGNQVSYNPPRYTYSYNYFIVIRVRHPYFDQMRFRINEFTVRVETTPSLSGLFTGQLVTGPGRSYECEKYEDMAAEIKQALLSGNRPTQRAAAPVQPATNFCANCGAPAGNGKFCSGCGAPLGR